MNEAPRATKFAIDWSWLAKLTPRALLAGLAFGWVLAFAVEHGPRPASGGWGGDYPAFHTAGRIVLEGRGSLLYDIDTQRSMEAELLDNGFLEFLYPPFVAAFYAPLALLPYRQSYLVFTLLSFAALAASVRLVRPLSSTVARDPWLVLAALACFYPLLRATLGGQNTALTLLILCGAWRLFCDGRDLAGGIVLGLLAYKPQYLVPVAGAVLLAGRPRSLVGVVLSVVGLYVAGAAVSGWGWPSLWIHEVAAFSANDREINAVNSVSLDSVAHVLGRDGLWVFLASALSAWVAWVAWRHGRQDFVAVFAFAAASSILIAPHAMYYDFGIAAPAILVLLDRGRVFAAGLLWMAGACQLLSADLPASPLVVVAAVVVAVLYREIRGRAASPL